MVPDLEFHDMAVEFSHLCTKTIEMNKYHHSCYNMYV